MPQLLPAAAAWAAAAWSSAVTVTAVGLTKVGVMAAIGEGATIALAGKIVGATAAMTLSAGAAALMRPNTPSSGTTLDFKPDPKAPVRGVMGYAAVGGSKVFHATWGYNRVAMSLGVALSLGPIDQVTKFRADDAVVSFAGPQNEATGFYAADMWQRTTVGLPGDAALLPPTGLKYGNPGLTGWGTQHAAPGVAFAFWTMVLAKNPEDRDIFTNGVPDPRWVGRWMKVWDPRKDSTYPGGSGPQRRDDWRTWGWSENPYVHALAWVRGWYKMNLDGSLDRTKRIAGIGAPDVAIDMPAFVEGMNVADANAWAISGEWSTSDSKFQTLVAMLQAGGGEPISRGAQISVMVNAPRVATYTYTRDDLIGAAEVRTSTPRRERKNTIIPRYRSEAHGWEYVPAGEVTSQVYRDEDRGEPRSIEIEYVHVRHAKQAGQLGAYDLANLREGLTATLPSKAHLMHVHPGDCITVDLPEVALARQKFLVRRATVDHKSATVTLELRAESDAKHAWALGQVANPPPSPSLSAVDPKYVPPPPAENWVITPRPPSEDGTSQPVIVVEGVVDTGDIASVILEYGLTSDGPWTVGYTGPPMADGRYEMTGVEPNTEYWVSIRYVAKNGAISDRLITGPITSGALSAGIDQEALDQIRDDFDDLFGPVRDDVDGLVSASAANAAAILKEAQDRAAALLKEAQDRAAAILAERTARGEDIAEVVSSIDVVRTDLSVEVSTRTSQIAAVQDAVSLVETNARTYVDDEIAEASLNFVTTAAFQGGLSTTLNSAKAHADGIKTYADQTFATTAALGTSAASTLASSKSYADGIKTYADQTFATTAALGTSAAGTLTSAKSYADGIKTYADQTFATTAALGTSAANTLSSAKSYADGKVADSRLTLATKAERADGDASTLISARSYTDVLRTDATTLFATKAALGTAEANASLALSTAVSADGRAKSLIGLETQVGGLITGIYSGNDGRIGSVRISAHHFSVETPGNPGDRIEFTGTNGLKLFKNNVRRIQIGFV